MIFFQISTLIHQDRQHLSLLDSEANSVDVFSSIVLLVGRATCIYSYMSFNIMSVLPAFSTHCSSVGRRDYYC